MKDLIEGCGVPHTEIDLILENDRPVGFGHLIERGARFEVFGCGEVPERFRGRRMQSREPRRFALDCHLGKLAGHLRLLGFDTLYDPEMSDAALLSLRRPDRALLSRDRPLLMHREVRHGFCPRADDPDEQAREVLRRFGISASEFAPFSRCLGCNGRLEAVPKDEIEERLEPLTRRHFETFRRCRGCGRVYWRGSHAARLEEFVRRFAGAVE